MSRRKVQKIYNKFSLLYLVKKVIDKYDFEMLLADGCPEDEYYYEAKRVCKIINIHEEYNDTAFIGDYLWHVFRESFGRFREDYSTYELNMFYDAAEEIAKKIKWYHKILPRLESWICS